MHSQPAGQQPQAAAPTPRVRALEMPLIVLFPCSLVSLFGPVSFFVHPSNIPIHETEAFSLSLALCHVVSQLNPRVLTESYDAVAELEPVLLTVSQNLLVQWMTCAWLTCSWLARRCLLGGLAGRPDSSRVVQTALVDLAGSAVRGLRSCSELGEVFFEDSAHADPMTKESEIWVAFPIIHVMGDAALEHSRK